MKTYKIWLAVEEYDSETDEHRDLCNAGEVEPVDIPVGGDLAVAEAFLRAMDMSNVGPAMVALVTCYMTERLHV